MIVTAAHRDIYVEVQGLRLHAVDYEPAVARAEGATPAVLLHGVTGNAAVWSFVAPPLASRRRVLALDMRGYGDSQWSASQAYATSDHAHDVVALLDALDLPQVDVVGSSWGGLVALATAAAAPARIRRLAIVDVEPSYDQDEADVPPRPQTYASHTEAVALERGANPHADTALLDLVVAHGTRSTGGGGLVPKHDPFFFERWPFRSDDWWDALGAVAAPTLVVHAGTSFVRREVTERMAAALPNGRHVEIAASTHVVPIDAPAPLARHLEDFLQ